TGGIAAVENIVANIGSLGSRMLRGVKRVGEMGEEALEKFITFLRTAYRNITKNAKQFFEDFKQWLDELIVAVKKKLGLVDEVLKISDESLHFLKTMADDALKLPTKERPKACGVLEGIETVFNYSYKKKLPAGVFPDDLHPLVDKWVREMWELHIKGKLRLPEHHGKCAEVMNISQYLKKIDPKGKMTIEEARKALEGFVSHAKQITDDIRKGEIVLKHGEYKKACNSCNPQLKHFNIKEFKVN
ncbi:MAG: hypothetical protein JNL75_07070, partial [Chitinophagales bacterium]|nr:hypothetical protein [Chitinophagales bacterium]